MTTLRRCAEGERRIQKKTSERIDASGETDKNNPTTAGERLRDAKLAKVDLRRNRGRHCPSSARKQKEKGLKKYGKKRKTPWETAGRSWCSQGNRSRREKKVDAWGVKKSQLERRQR